MILHIRNFTKRKISHKKLENVAKHTLKTINIKSPVEISLVIIGKQRIRALNRKYRNVDKVTDVLSFGNEDSNDDLKFVFPPNKVVFFGEIFICYLKMQEQAKEKKHSLEKEFSILLIHGILHLAGMEHLESYENSQMKEIEIKVFRKL